MPEITRPDGAVIFYEVFGSGYPFLLIAPGGVSSQISIWESRPINPIKEYADEFMVIAMDQRHAGRSPAPAIPFSYEQTSGDQLAVLDAVGAERAHVMGGCIGCAHIWALISAAPDRISAAVAQDPVGLDETNTVGTFYKMFNETMRIARDKGMDGVVEAAMQEPTFMLSNGGGPFSQRIHDDPEFREEIRKMEVETYVALIVRFRDGVWPDNPPYFTVSEEWMRQCPVPLLVLPGSDPFHPTGVAQKICREAPKARCLDVDCRSEAKVKNTIGTIRQFLRDNRP